MELDIQTLSFALLLTFFIQAIAFFLMTFAMKSNGGTRLWALSELLIALGFGMLLLRSLGISGGWIIMASNALHVGGILCFYEGSKAFFQYKKHLYPTLIVLTIYLLFVAYFTFYNPQKTYRIIAFSLLMIPITLRIGWLFFHQGKGLMKSASRFIGWIFVFDSIFFLVRAIYHISPAQIPGSLTIDNVHAITLLISMCFGLIWTMGIIVLVNYRLYEELVDAKNLFELIFLSIPEAVTILEKESLKVVNANPGFCNLIGYQKEEVLATPTIIQQIWKDQETFLPLLEELNQKGNYRNQEIQIQTKDGSVKIGLLSSTLFTNKNNNYILSIGRDMTEFKQKELELAQKSRKLEEVVSEKDKFFSILAHDLRGPIVTALALTDLMTDPKNDLSREELLDLSVSLNKSIYSTKVLLENLLEWTGVRRGFAPFFRTVVDFSELMKPILPSLIDSANNKKITLINEIPEDLSLFVDVHMAQSIFRNLIVNAIKFTREGGIIKLSVKQNAKNQTVFSVTDTGIGISAEVLNNLFHLDFKNNRQGTNGENSSGLGLLLCKEFVDKHEGSIWVESEEGKGSTFSFVLTGD